MAKIVVLGSGGWGMALGLSAYNCSHKVTLWSPFEAETKMLSEYRTNEKLLKDVYLPGDMDITTDLSVIKSADLVVIAVPSSAVREVAGKISDTGYSGIIVNLSKGLEAGTYKRLSEVISEENKNCRIVILSGPSHAEEVARNIPTSLVAAGENENACKYVQDLLSSEFLRIYTCSDLIGVELGGALKNAIAICAGICDGLRLGDNSKAALITRGLSEMAKLGVKLGADPLTFAGLSGIGDLVVTCTSKHSRNNHFGYKVGKGENIQNALKEVGTVEGYYATKVAYELAQKYGVDMPIIETCYGVLYEGKPIDSVVKDLMLRPKRTEKG